VHQLSNANDALRTSAHPTTLLNDYFVSILEVYALSVIWPLCTAFSSLKYN